jgi:spore maturation protein CgeB
MTMTSLHVPRRVFIIANKMFDSVGDSYRRALARHYDVALADVDEIVPSKSDAWTGVHSARLNQALGLLSRVVLGDPVALVSSRLRSAVQTFDPDIILTTAIATLPPRLLEHFRSDVPRVKIIGVFSDHIANFGRGYFFGADYDALFFKDHYIVDKLRSKLSWRNVFYLPQACDPELHRPISLTQQDIATFGCDITLAGYLHYFRAAELAPLIGRDFRIWGDSVPRWLDHPITKHCPPRYVAGDDKCRAMLAAKIVLNANHYGEISGTNKRTFEVAAIGAFQLTDTPALSDVFTPDVEVAAFDSQADMLEKIEYYLARPDLRRTMAKRACERAHREHTYAHRWTAKMVSIGCEVPAGFPVQAKDLTHRAV